MQSENRDDHLLEFKEYLARPSAHDDPLELLKILRRILPLTPVPTYDSVSLSHLSSAALHHDVPWLPEAPPMPPRSVKNLTTPHEESDDINNASSPPYVSPYEDYPHSQYEVQSQTLTYGPQLSQVAPIAEQTPISTPLSSSGSRPLLPPFSSILQRSATVHSNPSTQITHNPPGSQATMSPVSFARPPRRSAPPVSHIRTSSIASSNQTSSSAYGNAAAPSVSGASGPSITSGASSQSVLTPDNFSMGHGVPWTSANPTSRHLGSSGRSASSVAVGTKADSGAPQPRALPTLPTHANRPDPAPLGPDQAIPRVPQHVAAPTNLSTASAPANVSCQGRTPNSDARPGNRRKVPRTGGPAYVDKAERGRAQGQGNFRLHEDGYMVHWTCAPDAPRHRLQDILAPRVRNGEEPWEWKAIQELVLHPKYFNGTREPEQVYHRVMGLKDTLVDIQRFAQHYSIDFSQGPDTDQLLWRIQDQIAELWKLHGVRISIGPWRLLEFVRNSWYHWMRVSALGDLPSVQTRTTRRSGHISPSVASAPSALPTQARVLSRPAPPVPAHAPSRPSLPVPTPSQVPQPPSESELSAPPDPAQHGVESGSTLGFRAPSNSSFRVPRDSSTGRLARRNAPGSTASAGGARPMRYARSATGSAPIGWPATLTESSSATGASRSTNSPAEKPPSNPELVRQGQKQLELKELEVAANVQAAEAAVKENARVNDLTLHLMQASFDLKQQEAAQRMQLERERLQAEQQLEREHLQVEQQRVQLEQQRVQLEQRQVELEQQRLQLEQQDLQLHVDRLAVQSITSQLSIAAGSQQRPPGVIMGSRDHHLPQSGNFLPLSQPFVANFDEWMAQARAYYAHSLRYSGPYLPAINHPGSHHSSSQAGPSNHSDRLRGTTPPGASQFEDLGTIAGTPRPMAAADATMNDVEGMQLEDDVDDLYEPL